MSTYYIADSIDKFTKAFKEVIREKNSIEKEKLAFEKEKFEFEKKKLELESNKQQETCEHKWFVTGSSINSGGATYHYTCSKCGAKDTISLSLTT